MGFEPAHQMRHELWEKAGEEAERLLPKHLTDDLLKKVEKGQQIALIMSMPGWDILEEILLKELHLGKMIEDAGNDKLDVAHTYRIGIMAGVMKRIYVLPQIAEKAKVLLEKDAKRRKKNDDRRAARESGRGVTGTGRVGRWIGRDGKRSSTETPVGD